jgi:hypothetical protein
MKFSNIIVVVTWIITLVSETSAQNDSLFLRGFGIEIGGGQNNLYWTNNGAIPRTPGWRTHKRTYLALTPNVRFNYLINLNNDFSVLPFVGYNCFGGTSNITEGDQDRYLFDLIETGSFMIVNLSDFRFGTGIKANRLLRVSYDLFSIRNTHEDRSKLFSKWSADAGVHSSFIFPPMSISIEAWLGLTNLMNNDWTIVRENHYRVFIGYSF